MEIRNPDFGYMVFFVFFFLFCFLGFMDEIRS